MVTFSCIHPEAIFLKETEQDKGRQTISKWEQGLSVADSDMLISISELLETPVSTLLGETIIEPKADDLKVISERLGVINLQLAQRKNANRRTLHTLILQGITSNCLSIL